VLNGCPGEPVKHFCKYRDALGQFRDKTLYGYYRATNYYSLSGRDDSEILKKFQN
jgi:hypothetical protein